MISARLTAALWAFAVLSTQFTQGQNYYDEDYLEPTDSPIVDVTLPPSSVDLNTDPPVPTRAPDPSLQLCSRDSTVAGCPKTWSDAAAKLIGLMTKVRLDNVVVITDYTSIKDELERLRKVFRKLKAMARFTNERVFSPAAVPIQDPSRAVLLYTPENLVGGRYDGKSKI